MFIVRFWRIFRGALFFLPLINFIYHLSSLFTAHHINGNRIGLLSRFVM